MQRVVITRFNLRYNKGYDNDKHGKKIEHDEWMQHRLALFEQFRLPSLAAQSNQDFTCLLLLDEGRSCASQQTQRRIHTLYMSGNGHRSSEFLFSPQTTKLISTRIDNDDAFHVDALRIIRHEADQVTTSNLALNFKFAYSYNGTDAEVVSHKYNPFATLVECKAARTAACKIDAAFATVFSAGGHGKIHRIATVKQITDAPTGSS